MADIYLIHTRTIDSYDHRDYKYHETSNKSIEKYNKNLIRDITCNLGYDLLCKLYDDTINNKVTCDVKILLKHRSQPIYAHSVILNQYLYFQKYITKNNCKNGHYIVNLQTIDILLEKKMIPILQIMYKGTCDLSKYEIIDMLILMYLGNMLQVQAVIDECVDFMKGTINFDNACGYFKTILNCTLDNSSIEQLKIYCRSYIQHNMNVINDTNWIKLPFKCIYDILKPENKSKDASHELILYGALNWIYREGGENNNRSNDNILQLANCISWHSIPYEDFNDPNFDDPNTYPTAPNKLFIKLNNQQIGEIENYFNHEILQPFKYNDENNKEFALMLSKDSGSNYMTVDCKPMKYFKLPTLNDTEYLSRDSRQELETNNTILIPATYYRHYKVENVINNNNPNELNSIRLPTMNIGKFIYVFKGSNRKEIIRFNTDTDKSIKLKYTGEAININIDTDFAVYDKINKAGLIFSYNDQMVYKYDVQSNKMNRIVNTQFIFEEEEDGESINWCGYQYHNSKIYLINKNGNLNQIDVNFSSMRKYKFNDCENENQVFMSSTICFVSDQDMPYRFGLIYNKSTRMYIIKLYKYSELEDSFINILSNKINIGAKNMHAICDNDNDIFLVISTRDEENNYFNGIVINYDVNNLLSIIENIQKGDIGVACYTK